MSGDEEEKIDANDDAAVSCKKVLSKKKKKKKTSKSKKGSNRRGPEIRDDDMDKGEPGQQKRAEIEKGLRDPGCKYNPGSFREARLEFIYNKMEAEGLRFMEAAKLWMPSSERASMLRGLSSTELARRRFVPAKNPRPRKVSKGAQQA